MIMIFSNDKVEKPVFVLGSPRSGTTLLYDTLCKHKDLAYINLNVLRSRVHKLPPSIANILFKVFNTMYQDTDSKRPHEANNFWIKYFGTYQYLTEKDYSTRMSEYYRKNIAAVQKMNKRPRFVNKNMQNCVRVHLLHKIFPDAKFVHIIRDGRAVAFSLLKKIEREIIPSVFDDSVEKLLGDQYMKDRSILFNYGLAWAELVKRAREARSFGVDSYYEVRYEELLSRPYPEFKKVIEFCELDFYDRFEQSIPMTINMNVKWKQKATDEQRIDLEESTLEIRKILGID